MTVVGSFNPVQSSQFLAGATTVVAGTEPDPLPRQQLELLQIVARTAELDDVDLAYHELADSLQRSLNCRQVVIGICRRRNRRCRVQAISSARTLSRQSKVVRCMEAAMDEAVLRNDIDAKDISSIFVGQATVTQKELSYATNSSTVISSPIRSRDGQVHGAWLVLDNDTDRDVSAMVQRVRAAEPLVAVCLRLLRRSHRGGASQRLARLFGKGSRARRWTIAAVTLAVVALLVSPRPYKVACKCSVQPVTRRYVVAPYEGILEKALVEPGDRVTGGQVVARMDEREIRWELAGLEAEYNRAHKQRDTSLAGLDTAAAQLSRLEMERLQLKIRLLENRANHLEIKTPVDGVVISGDPKKMEGARLTTGQTLLEVGPLDQMVVEAAVPDEDVSHVAAGQTVTIRFEARPGRDYTGTVDRIHPRSETQDQANVFVAEIRLDNADGSLRPGMLGRVKVRAASHPLAWNLFHKAWDRLALRMGW